LNLRTDDAEGDGFNNVQEFLFGTSPIASNGSLVTTTTSGGNIVLRWLQRETGSTYTLVQSATLETGSWTTASQIPALDGVQTGAPTDYDYYTVTIPIGSGKLFFRIVGLENGSFPPSPRGNVTSQSASIHGGLPTREAAFSIGTIRFDQLDAKIAASGREQSLNAAGPLRPFHLQKPTHHILPRALQRLDLPHLPGFQNGLFHSQGLSPCQDHRVMIIRGDR